MKRTIAILCACLLLMAFTSVAFADDVIGTLYSSTFRFSSGTLTGQTRDYTNGVNMGINCSNVTVSYPSGYTPLGEAKYNVTLYKTGVNKGTIYNFPIVSTTYCGRWNGKGPGSSIASYRFDFTPVNNKCKNSSNNIKYGTIQGDCSMFALSPSN